MIIEKDSITGLLLAGGQGRRVNGQDKGLLSWHGETLAARQCRWLASQLNRTLISANRNLDFYRSFGVDVLVDSSPGFSVGPLAGLQMALDACQTEWLFCLPVDLPCLPNDLIQQVLEYIQLNRIEGDCFYLATQQRAHYLSMLVASKYASALSEFIDNEGKRVGEWLAQIQAKPLYLSLDENHFKNINSLELL